jgi:hypothetical protein
MVSSTPFEGIFYMPQICDMGQTALLSFRRKERRIFSPEKIRLLQPGLNPRTWVPEASMLITRTPKPLRWVFMVMPTGVPLSGPDMSLDMRSVTVSEQTAGSDKSEPLAVSLNG